MSFAKEPIEALHFSFSQAYVFSHLCLDILYINLSEDVTILT